jgi:NifU-like protein
MWDYTDKVMDHFRNPRNIGWIENPDGVGEVGSLACGDALRLMFKLDDQGRIVDAKFQTFGCGSAIASSSALTEMIRGLTLEEAERVTNQDIASFLGGLPEQKMHCSVMGREALEAAIENYRTGGEVKRDLEGRVVCVCFGVTEKTIERAIREDGCRSVEEVTNYTKAGGGCGGCRSEIERIVARVLGEELPETGAKPERPRLSNIRKIQLIQETIDADIRPALQQDGGDLELVDVDGRTVIVSLRGSCASCPVSAITLRDFVEARLREFVSDDLVVVEEG